VRVDYTFTDIENAYRTVGLENAEAVLIESDLASLGFYEVHKPDSICQAHVDALRTLIGDEGLIVVPTNSDSLSKSGDVFDPLTTPSEWGMFSEYVRTRAGAVRSMHPLDSFAAHGPAAAAICGDVSRHAFGPRTPIGNLLEMDTTFLSIGVPPRFTPVLVHHIELVMGVPHRYVREFVHPVRRNGKVQEEFFYRHVWYYECNIKKDYNKKLFKIFNNKYEIKQYSLGRGTIYAYSLKELYDCALDALTDNLYLLLEEPPKTRPYRESM